eukprot:TRINITY_DN3430_c0_g1_i8.p1 TRINITY_DN3430_c0_g1~~TRINITY_DN3430_c0_g1_i8.p1  ORF type:complete len:1050 (-),score=105.84 TRINITY_DN3430_c0_g1_i8:130-3279(-)
MSLLRRATDPGVVQQRKGTLSNTSLLRNAIRKNTAHDGNVPIDLSTPRSSISRPIDVSTPRSSISRPIDVSTPRSSISRPIDVSTPRSSISRPFDAWGDDSFQDNHSVYAESAAFSYRDDHSVSSASWRGLAADIDLETEAEKYTIDRQTIRFHDHEMESMYQSMNAQKFTDVLRSMMKIYSGSIVVISTTFWMSNSSNFLALPIGMMITISIIWWLFRTRKLSSDTRRFEQMFIFASTIPILFICLSWVLTKTVAQISLPVLCLTICLVIIKADYYLSMKCTVFTLIISAAIITTYQTAGQVIIIFVPLSIISMILLAMNANYHLHSRRIFCVNYVLENHKNEAQSKMIHAEKLLRKLYHPEVIEWIEGKSDSKHKSYWRKDALIVGLRVKGVFASKLSKDEKERHSHLRAIRKLDSLADKHDLEKIKQIGDILLLSPSMFSKKSIKQECESVLAYYRDITKTRAGSSLGFISISLHMGPICVGLIENRRRTLEVFGAGVEQATHMLDLTLLGFTSISVDVSSSIPGLFDEFTSISHNKLPCGLEYWGFPTSRELKNTASGFGDDYYFSKQKRTFAMRPSVNSGSTQVTYKECWSFDKKEEVDYYRWVVDELDPAEYMMYPVAILILSCLYGCFQLQDIRLSETRLSAQEFVVWMRTIFVIPLLMMIAWGYGFLSEYSYASSRSNKSCRYLLNTSLVYYGAYLAIVDLFAQQDFRTERITLFEYAIFRTEYFVCVLLSSVNPCMRLSAKAKILCFWCMVRLFSIISFSGVLGFFGFLNDILVNFVLLGIIMVYASYLSELHPRNQYRTRLGQRLEMDKATDEQCYIEEIILTVIPPLIYDSINQDMTNLVNLNESSLLFVKISNWTELANGHEAQSVTSFNNDFYQYVSDLCESYGCDFIKIVDHGCLILCNHCYKDIHHTIHLARLFFELRDCTQVFSFSGTNKRVRICGVISAGVLHGGVVGDSRVSFDVWGPPAEDVWKLRHHAGEDSLLVTSSCANTLKSDGVYDITPLPDLQSIMKEGVYRIGLCNDAWKLFLQYVDWAPELA